MVKNYMLIYSNMNGVSKERPDETQERLNKLRGIKDRALEAFKTSELLIIDTEITPDNAVQLGGGYLVYRTDYYLYAQQVAEISEQQGNGASLAEVYKEDRLEGEKAIAEAQRGDYRGVKGIILREGSASIKLAKTHEPEQLQIGLKLTEIAENIPDTGKPFSPPRPVTMYQ